MHKSLPELYKETDGFRNIPKELRPNRIINFAGSLVGDYKHRAAQGNLDDGGYFIVHKYKDREDIWMDVYRPDKTLRECQHYDPTAKAYTHSVAKYNAPGKKLLHYTATSPDGRTIEEITRNGSHKLERTCYYYPDINAEAMYDEKLRLSPSLTYHSTLDRYYRDDDYTKLEIEKYTDRDGLPLKNISYHPDGKQIEAISEYNPGQESYSSIRSFTATGLKEGEWIHNKAGKLTRYIEYHTEGIEPATEQQKKFEQLYKDDILQTEFQYHPDGILRRRRDFEADGKTFKLIQLYNSTGEHPTIIQHYKSGKLDKKTTYTIDENGNSQEKRIILYKDGKPYRSQERHDWGEGEVFWAETELDPETYHPTSSLLPTPTGLIRQHYDKNTGSLKKVERFREPGLGETLEQVTHFYPNQRSDHPEIPDPVIAKSIEKYGEDGETLTEEFSYRTDGSLKFHDNHEDGEKYRKAYPPDTIEVEEDTPVIFESVTGTNGKLQQSTLRAHNDPAIIALHKQYGPDGNPSQIRIETVDGEETLSWQEYKERKTAERQQWQTGPVRLATIAPDVTTPQKNKETYSGHTIITLQGDVQALRRAEAKLKHKITDVQCQLYTGDKQWNQYKGQPGHYVPSVPPTPPADHPLEKVNVLKVIIPYQKYEGDKWPRTFSTTSSDDDNLSLCRERARQEASEALLAVFRNTRCDLGLTVRPFISKHKKKNNQIEYHPFVIISWPNGTYLPATQCDIITDMLSDNISKREFACSTKPGKSEIVVYAATTSFLEGAAKRIAWDTAKQLTAGLIPAPARQR